MAARVVDREGNYYLCDKGQYAYFVYDKDTVNWGGDYQLRVFEVTKDKHVTGHVIWDCGFAETYDDALACGQALKERAIRSVEQQNREVLEARQKELRTPHLTQSQTEMVLRQVAAALGSTLTDSAHADSSEEAELPKTNLRPAYKDNKWGYVDTSERFVVPPKFSTALPFSEALAAVSVDGKWGYIDPTGEFAIKPQFFAAQGFSSGLALVRSEAAGKYGYINRTGALVISVQFDDARSFCEGRAAVLANGKWGYIGRTGDFTIVPQFDWASNFSKGLANVSIGGKWNYIDTTGQFVQDDSTGKK